MLNMAARYGNAPAVRALLRAGAEASHADVSGWHMPLHHVTHCKGCSEEVALRIVQMLVDAGAEPGLARDKNGAAASVENKLALRPASSPVAAFSGRSCLRLPAALKLRPASASQPLGPRCPTVSGLSPTQITATKGATRRGWTSVVRLLRARQATPLPLAKP